MTKIQIFAKGILVENPLLILSIGLCSSLGITTSIFNALGMGAGMTFVLVMSELVISLFRHHIPSSIRLPVFIIIIAAFTTIVQMMLQAYVPSLYDALGVFLPLITTNCCILGVAILVGNGTYDAAGMEHGLVTGVWFALCTALGFGLALIVFAGIREQLARMDVPKGMQGMAIALVVAGLLSMAFMGFSGVNNGLAKLF